MVHEAYLRLLDSERGQDWNSRGHFFAAAARAMRRILVDNARRKRAQKRGASLQREPLDAVAAPEIDEEFVALDEALQELAEAHPTKARLVELRYFAGLTSEQAAKILDISPATADRYWAYARAWLHNKVRGR